MKIGGASEECAAATKQGEEQMDDHSKSAKSQNVVANYRGWQSDIIVDLIKQYDF